MQTEEKTTTVRPTTIPTETTDTMSARMAADAGRLGRIHRSIFVT